MLKEKNPQLEAARDVLFDLGEKSDYGTEFSFEHLLSISGVDKAQFYQVVRQANRKLITHRSRMFQNVRGIGYKVATPPEQLDHAGRRKIYAMRQIKEAQRQVENLDVSRLSKEEQDRATFQNAIFSSMLSTARKRTLLGITATKVSLKRQEEALGSIEQMKQYIDGLKEKLSLKHTA